MIKSSCVKLPKLHHFLRVLIRKLTGYHPIVNHSCEILYESQEIEHEITMHSFILFFGYRNIYKCTNTQEIHFSTYSDVLNFVLAFLFLSGEYVELTQVQIIS